MYSTVLRKISGRSEALAIDHGGSREFFCGLSPNGCRRVLIDSILRQRYRYDLDI